jgi:hypothetical protein
MKPFAPRMVAFFSTTMARLLLSLIVPVRKLRPALKVSPPHPEMAALMAAVSTVTPSPFAPKSCGSQKPVVGGGAGGSGGGGRRGRRRRGRGRRCGWRHAWGQPRRQTPALRRALARRRGREQAAGQAVGVVAQLPCPTAVAVLAAGGAATSGVLHAFELLVVRRLQELDALRVAGRACRGSRRDHMHHREQQFDRR